MAIAHRLCDFKNIFGTLSYVAITQFSYLVICLHIHAVVLKNYDILNHIHLTSFQYPQTSRKQLLGMI